MKKMLTLFLFLTCLAGCAPAVQNTQISVELYDSPPAMTVICGENEIEALPGTSSWSYRKADDDMVITEIDGLHPEKAKEIMPRLIMPPSIYSHKEPYTAELKFEKSPDRVSVRCWQAEYFGNKGAVAEEMPVLCMDNSTGEEILMISMEEGKYIYEVYAEWNRFEEFGGDAYYSFLALPSYMVELK